MESYNDTLRQGDHVGCYQIEQVLGRGGFAATYLAHDLHLDLQVALKEYLPRDIVRRDPNLNVVPSSEDFVDDYDIGLKNFAREAKTLARFKHPNIVRVHNVLHKYHTAYMVMDYERGVEMAQLLDERHTIDESDLLAIVVPVLDGLEEIHKHGYLHRDIKPSNIYLREHGQPVLLDFGAARFAMSEATQQLTAVVTVGYTPIEQYNISQEDQGAWSDIYAMAAVLYEAVTGEMPVDSITRATALQVKRDTDPLPPSRRSAARDYSAGFLDAIDWGLQFKAEDRPQTVAQWREAMFADNAPVRRPMAPRRDLPSTRPEPRVSARPDTNDPRIDFADLTHNVDSHDMPVLEELVVDQPTTLKTRNVQARPVMRRSTQPESKLVRSDTQEVRDVVRRDIMGRTHHEPLPEPLNLASDPDFTDIEDGPERYQRAPVARPKEPVAPAPIDARSFAAPEDDDRDWDLPQPSKLAALRWILPAVSLASIIAGALYFVNQPAVPPTPAASTDAPFDTNRALATAKTLEATGYGVFPVDYSALDYYRQILHQQPDNPLAMDGLARIERNLTSAIDAGVEANELARVNRLLARAKSAGLDVSGSAPTLEPKPPAEPDSAPPVENDFVTDRVNTIREHLANNRIADATDLFAQTEPYIADTATLDSLRAEIEARTLPPAPALVQQNLTDISAAPVSEQLASLPASAVPPAETITTPEPATAPKIVPPPKGSTIASGSLGRHLEKLRQAIESRSINAVLANSKLSADREKFVRQMFGRYDHLSVTINQVQQGDNRADAKLNIAMYNRKRDGSYYSAGRWNGVTLSTSRTESGDWTSIRW